MAFSFTRQSIPAGIVGQQTWPLKITVTSTEGHPCPAEVFVFHKGQAGVGAYAGDVFECVASVAQLNEIGTDPETLTPPVDSPAVDDGNTVPYYRAGALTFDCRSPEEADDLWLAIKGDIEDLVRNILAKNTFTTEETVTL